MLKHIVVAEVIEHLKRKDKSFTYIDTHAGSALYDFESSEASRLKEYESGIGRLALRDWPELSVYLDLLDSLNARMGGSAESRRFYPGSPLIAASLMRSRDQGKLFELHPQEFGALQQNLGNDRRFTLSQKDGLAGLLAQLPPVSRRGFVLIDPSYEVKADYEAVVVSLCKAHRKFATGIYALWYPVVDRRRIDLLVSRLCSSGIRNIQRFELGITQDCTDPLQLNTGMTSAGMIVINPPWGLYQTMMDVLPRLAEFVSSTPGESCFKVEVLVGE